MSVQSDLISIVCIKYGYQYFLASAYLCMMFYLSIYMYPFFFSNLFFIFFPHLEKVYHFWMYFGRRWNPGTCHLSTSEIVRIWTSDLGDRSLRQFFQCDEDCFYLSKRDFFQTMSSQIDQENSRRKKDVLAPKNLHLWFDYVIFNYYCMIITWH